MREFNPNPGSVVGLDREGCSHNVATLPCATIQQVVLLPNTEREIDFGQGIGTVFISDPDIIDAFPVGGGHQLLIKPKRQKQTVTNNNGTTAEISTVLRGGNSDIFVYDLNSNLISAISVFIDPFSARSPVSRDHSVVTAGSVEIYVGKNLRELSNYRCASFLPGCVYVGQ